MGHTNFKYLNYRKRPKVGHCPKVGHLIVSIFHVSLLCQFGVYMQTTLLVSLAMPVRTFLSTFDFILCDFW